MASISEGFTLKNQYPNFDRDAVATLEALRNVKVRHYDIGHIVFCEETNEHYKFMGDSIEFDEISGYFRILVPTNPDISDQLEGVNNQIESITGQIGDVTEQTDDALIQLEKMAVKVETMWNEMFPPYIPTIAASIKLCKAGTNTELPSNPRGYPIDIDVHISIKEDDVVLDNSRIKSIKLVYGSKTINIPVGTTKYTVTEISNTTSFTVTYTLDNDETRTASKQASFYEPTIAASIKLYRAGSNISISGTYEYGEPVNIEARISITEGGKAIDVSRINSVKIAYGGKTDTLENNATKHVINGIYSSTTFTVTYNVDLPWGGTRNVTSSASISFQYSSYYGVIEENTSVSEIDITSLTKKLTSSKAITFTVKLDNQKCCYLYPTSYGQLTSIKDSMNYELINSFVRENITLKGITYYAYILEYAATVEDDYKLTFS